MFKLNSSMTIPDSVSIVVKLNSNAAEFPLVRIENAFSMPYTYIYLDGSTEVSISSSDAILVKQ